MTVTIKGTADGLVVTLGEGEWDAEFAALTERIASSAKFFSGAQATLDVGARSLDAAEIARLRDLFGQQGGTLRGLVAADGTTRAAARALGLTASAPRARVAAPPRGENESRSGLVVRRTVRSGQSVRHMGHVVIIGDVNPGGEVVAGGDVVVWGRLRGLVHAGATGDPDAWVCALHLAPTQLRIADLFSRAPDGAGEPKRHALPEVARIRDGKIVVEAWDEP